MVDGQYAAPATQRSAGWTLDLFTYNYTDHHSVSDNLPVPLGLHCTYICTILPPSPLLTSCTAQTTSFFPCSCSRALRLCAILSACAFAAAASKVLFVSSASSASLGPPCIASSPSTVLPSSQSESKAKLSSALDADCRPSSRSLIGSSSTMELVLDGPGSQFNVSGNRSNFPRPPR
jgi:hypothetical protein